MFDRAKYDVYKAVERDLLGNLIPKQSYRDWPLERLVGVLSEQCSEPLSNRSTLVLQTGKAIRLRSEMIFSWYGRSWYSHLAFLGVLALLREMLNPSQHHHPSPTTPDVTNDSDVAKLLQDVLSVQWQGRKRASYWVMAVAVCRQRPLIATPDATSCAKTLNYCVVKLSSAPSGQHNLMLAGFVAFVIQRMEVEELPVETPPQDMPQPGAKHQSAQSIAELEHDAFWAELNSLADLILRLWKGVLSLPRLGPVALGKAPYGAVTVKANIQKPHTVFGGKCGSSLTRPPFPTQYG